MAGHTAMSRAGSHIRGILKAMALVISGFDSSVEAPVGWLDFSLPFEMTWGLKWHGGDHRHTGKPE